MLFNRYNGCTEVLLSIVYLFRSPLNIELTENFTFTYCTFPIRFYVLKYQMMHNATEYPISNVHQGIYLCHRICISAFFKKWSNRHIVKQTWFILQLVFVHPDSSLFSGLKQRGPNSSQMVVHNLCKLSSTDAVEVQLHSLMLCHWLVESWILQHDIWSIQIN